MAITTLTPESITEIDHGRRHSNASYSQYSSYSSSNSNSSPELSSPILLTSCKGSFATPRSNSSHESPPVVPKIEEIDDPVSSLDKLPELPEPGDAKPLVILTDLRKRGRPRKNPVPVVEQKRSAHARSKTGCGTCRRRKKKCDETRPSCTNCEKNNVICDGYEHKKPWRSGREKALINRQAAPLPPLPPLYFGGVENDTDWKFLEYFTEEMSSKLSLNTTEKNNPFIKVIVPMAMHHNGLMSSLLSLSGSCLLVNAHTKDPVVEYRVNYNNWRAARLLGEEIKQRSVLPVATVEDPSIAQSLLMCLQTVGAGEIKGEWRRHINGMKSMLATATAGPFADKQFRRFVLEFLLYHDYSSSITSRDNPLNAASEKLMQEFQETATITPEAATLLGVADGLFLYISQIRKLRDLVRKEQEEFGYYSAETRSIAYHLHRQLAAWKCQYEENTPRYWASLLYRQCVVLYLHRTVNPSKPLDIFKQSVDDSLRYLRELSRGPDDEGTQSILLLPLFLLGCSAFHPEQRPEIRDAFIRLQGSTKLGNIRYAKEVVEDIWVMMDTGRAKDTWDWEKIIEQKKLDFLIT